MPLVKKKKLPDVPGRSFKLSIVHTNAQLLHLYIQVVYLRQKLLLLHQLTALYRPVLWFPSNTTLFTFDPECSFVMYIGILLSENLNSFPC